MKKGTLYEGITLVFAGYYVLTHEYIYDSLVGASINIEYTQILIGVGLIFFGLILIFNFIKKIHFKK